MQPAAKISSLSQCQCGNPPELVFAEFSSGPVHYVWCQKCGMQGPEKTHEREAITAWNQIVAAPDLLNAARLALPALYWSLTHQPGNLLQFSEVIAALEGAKEKALGAQPETDLQFEPAPVRFPEKPHRPFRLIVGNDGRLSLLALLENGACALDEDGQSAVLILITAAFIGKAGTVLDLIRATTNV